MPIEVKRWLCAACKSEHLTLGDAHQCEALPLQDETLLVGQSISFQVEQQMFSRWSYHTETGTVLSELIDLVRAPEGEFHARRYFVAGKLYSQDVEFLIMWTNNGWSCPYDSIMRVGASTSIQHCREFPQ